MAKRETRRRLAEENLDIVRSMVRRVRAELGHTLDESDLVGYGAQGLLEAAARFDPKRGIPFPAYAQQRVRGAIIDGVRRMALLPRTLHARLRAAERVTDYLASDGGPAAPHLASELRAVLRALQAIGTIHVMTHAAETIDDIPDESPGPHEIAVFQRITPSLRDKVGALTRRERRFIQLCYFEHRSIAGAGASLGLSRSWSSRLHKRIIDKLRRQLTKEGWIDEDR